VERSAKSPGNQCLCSLIHRGPNVILDAINMAVRPMFVSRFALRHSSVPREGCRRRRGDSRGHGRSRCTRKSGAGACPPSRSAFRCGSSSSMAGWPAAPSKTHQVFINTGDHRDLQRVANRDEGCCRSRTSSCRSARHACARAATDLEGIRSRLRARPLYAAQCNRDRHLKRPPAHRSGGAGEAAS